MISVSRSVVIYPYAVVFLSGYDFCLVLPVNKESNNTTDQDGEKVKGFTPEGLECVQHLAAVSEDDGVDTGVDRNIALQPECILIKLSDSMLYYAMLCHAMPCYACYACYAMQCYENTGGCQLPDVLWCR
mgnify:CR=1 FL=1